MSDQERNPHTYGSQEFCDWLNVRLWPRRQDVEWMPDGNGGIALRDRPEWTEAHGKRIERRHEAERADWKHRQRYPAAARSDVAS